MFELFSEGYRALIRNNTTSLSSGLSAVFLTNTANSPTSESNANMTYVRANTASNLQFTFTDLGYEDNVSTSGSTSYIYLTSSGLAVPAGTGATANTFTSDVDQYGHIISEADDLVYGYFRASDTSKTFMNAGLTFTWTSNRIGQLSIAGSSGDENLSGYDAFYKTDVELDLLNNARLALVRNVAGASSSDFHDAIDEIVNMGQIGEENGGIDNATVTMLTSGHQLSGLNFGSGTSKFLTAGEMVIPAAGTHTNVVIMLYSELGALGDGGANAIPVAMFTDDFSFTFSENAFIKPTANGIIGFS